jgi:hypothetical protein
VVIYGIEDARREPFVVQVSRIGEIQSRIDRQAIGGQGKVADNTQIKFPRVNQTVMPALPAHVL